MRSVDVDRDRFIVGQLGQFHRDAADDFVEIVFLVAEVHASGLELGQIKQVVEQVGEAFGAFNDALQIAFGFAVVGVVEPLQAESRKA